MALLRGRRRRPPQDSDESSPTALLYHQRHSDDPSQSHDDSSSNNNDSDSDHWQPDPRGPAAAPKSRLPRSSRSGRLTRGTAAAAPASSVTVSRSPPSVNTGSPGAIHLTVKMSSSKLRQVTNSRSSRGTASNRHNIFTEEPVVQGKRSSRNTRNLREVSEDDEDDDDHEIEEEEEEDDDEIDDSEDGAGEDDDELDADGDLEMEDDTPQPPVSKRGTRPAAAAAKVKNKAVKSVEEKEMELSRDDEEDEELSELDSDAEGEPDDTMLQDEEMGEGVEEGEEDVEVDEDDGLGSDDSSSLDPNKLTKRQRGSLGKDFLQLPMEPQIKKHLTAEEHAMRRAEMARRRKNLSEKRNEEEKMDTINRLLKKQAPKRRGRIPAAETAGEATPDVPVEVEKPDPTMIRWIRGRESCKALVPEEILGTAAGRPFGSLPGGKLIEEV